MRAIGGIAVRLHSPQAAQLPALRREYADLDFVTSIADNTPVRHLLTELGFTPNTRFNDLQGKTRMLFYDPEEDCQIDVLIGVFRMCHTLPLAPKTLEMERWTLPLAELFLTKCQIVNLNGKDVKDIVALLLEHPLGSSDDETINQDRIVQVLSSDWGFFTTVTKNLGRVGELVGDLGLSPDQKEQVKSRIEEVESLLRSSPKSLGWELRAMVGERLRWYDEPEEAAREAIKLYPDEA
jgi:hypothetical protein